MKLSRRSFTKLALGCGGATLLHGCTGAVDGEASAESRVLLDEQFTWRSPDGADTLLRRMQRAGFNVLMPCLWAGQGVTWASEREVADPRMQRPLRAGADPFADLLRKAHRLGIEVHPWFKLAMRRRDFRREFFDEGTPDTAFDMHKPAFRRYIADHVLEVVDRYPIDGINLDYVRTKGNCTSAYCKRQYRQATGHDLMRDLDALVARSPAWHRLTAWNSAAVDDMVRDISERARRRRPSLLISADSHTGRDHWRIQGADSVTWANRGWVDVVYNMQYSKTIKQREIDVAVAALDEPQRMVVLNGNWQRRGGRDAKAVPRPAQEVVAAISASQRRFPGGNGVALYSYLYLSDEQITALAAGPFRIPARPSWPARRTPA